MLYSTTYVWNLKNNTNEPIYKTEIFTNIKNKLMANKGRRRWIKKKKKKNYGIIRYKLLHIK